MSTKEYGCFFCDGKSTDSSGSCGKCDQPIDISAELRALSIADYRVTDVIGRGFYGWTLKVDVGYQPFAMKVMPLSQLKEKTIPDEEARSLAACSPHRNIATFFRPVSTTLTIGGKQVAVLCLVFEYIAGARSLAKLVADTSVKLNRRDVTGILAGIASGLARMHARGLWHDDLHDDNVLVRTVASDENINERYEAKLIDFGSVKHPVANEPEHGEQSDYHYLSKHIYSLVGRFERGIYPALTPEDRTYAAHLRRLAHRLADKDVSRRNLTPESVVSELQRALDGCATGYDFPSFEEMKQQSAVSLKEPLENTNALNLAPQEIALLFVDPLRWEERLRKSEPVIVAGPRGCGKTMLLRYLSLTSQARPLHSENTSDEVAKRLKEIDRIGFLINCGQLRTPFLRSGYKKLEASHPDLAEDFSREYINAHFVLEILRTIQWLRLERLAAISEDDIDAMWAGLAALLDPAAVQHAARMNIDDAIEYLEGRITDLSNLAAPDAYQPSNLARDDVLVCLARALKSLAWAKAKEVWFMLDDYSVTVLPPFVQRSCNPAIFRLSGDVKVRLSSEGDGPVLEDRLGRKYQEGRELTKVNLGEIYFSATEKKGLQFFNEILEARFKETGKGSLDDLRGMLGSHPNERGFGKYLQTFVPPKRPGDARFYGLGLICRLCSGDVSVIIELLHTLTQGRWGAEVLPIDPIKQDEVVKQFCRRQLAELRQVSEYGPRMYDFAQKLGNLLKQYVLQPKTKPDERLRIEIEGTGALSEQAHAVEDALFRHSVLITGGSGKSRRGLPTRKLYFRRLFAPCFPFSPARGDCIALTVQQYEQWLLDPTTIWEKPDATQARGRLLWGEE